MTGQGRLPVVIVGSNKIVLEGARQDLTSRTTGPTDRLTLDREALIRSRLLADLDKVGAVDGLTRGEAFLVVGRT